MKELTCLTRQQIGQIEDKCVNYDASFSNIKNDRYKFVKLNNLIQS